MTANAAVLDSTDTAGDAPTEVDYIAKTTSVTAPAPTVDADRDDEEPADDKPHKPWFSGFCGPGPECNDERHRDGAGNIVRHCPYVLHNGEKAARKVLRCACACHQDAKRAGQALLESAA